MKTFLKIIGMLIFFLVLLGVGTKLFAPKWLDQKIADIQARFHPAVVTDHVLNIAYSEDATSLEPTSYNVANRNRLLNIYEGLVSIDRDLKVQPALALSWGMINPTTWEFSLRPNVKFHDGSSLDAEDVLVSFDRAAHFKNSELGSFTSNVEKIEKISTDKVRLITKSPDPILLNKLAAIFIFPSELKDTIAAKTIGSGAYKMINWEKGKGLTLEAFSDYWGEMPRYAQVKLAYIPDKQIRNKSMLAGQVDVLADVPFGSVAEFNGNKITIETQPSLEINFLVFDQRLDKTNLFADKRIRQAIAYALEKKEIARFMGSFAKPSQQFVSRGIFGFTQDLQEQTYDLAKADELVKEVDSFTRLKVDLDLADGLQVLGNYVHKQLFQIGIDVNLNYLSVKDLQEKIQAGKSHFFFLAWRSELGDVSDFYQALVHSRDKDGKYGQYNAGTYKNEKVDKLIEESSQIVDNPTARLAKLQDVMKILAHDDVFGVPLFETEVIYAVRPVIEWKSRVDGYILAKEIK